VSLAYSPLLDIERKKNLKKIHQTVEMGGERGYRRKYQAWSGSKRNPNGKSRILNPGVAKN